MDGDLEVTERLTIPAAELSWVASRASGPGGQHVNKTSSRVTLRWSVQDSEALRPWMRARLFEMLGARLTGEGVLQIHADSARSQLQNREQARARLAALVAEALKPRRARVATKPSRKAKQRRVDGKKRRGAIKEARQRPGADD